MLKRMAKIELMTKKACACQLCYCPCDLWI